MKEIPHSDNDVVISGISGRFPSSENMDELKYNLYNGIDMASDMSGRWDQKVYNLTPFQIGKIKSYDKFDAEFFGYSNQDASVIDPMQRKLLETTFEAIVDSGFDPKELRGKNIGLFKGDCFTHSNSNPYDVRTHPPTVVPREMYNFDLRGPLYHCDTACASTFNALNEAVLSIKNGVCDAAFISGANSIFDPYVSTQMTSLGFVCMERGCRALDNDANGYMRAEAAVTIFIQRRKDARRVYATIVKTATNCDGYKDEGITFPGARTQEKLFREAYEDIPICPADIKYIEGHSTGTKAGDPVETNVIQRVFCEDEKRKKDPLYLGCVKSNLGHSEGAAGLCALAKAILTLQNQMIPPNILYKTPNPDLLGIQSGVILPVTKPTPFNHSLIAINSLGFGGSNVHVIIQKEKKTSFVNPRSLVPRLVLVQGRTEAAVQYITEYIEKEPKCQTSEFLYLMDKYANVENMPHKAYMIIDPTRALQKPKITNSVTTSKSKNESKPVVLYLSGPSNNDCFTPELTLFSPYAESLKRSKQILEKIGYDFNNLTPNVLSVVTQIAWIDSIREVGLASRIDQVVASGLGEFSAAYFYGKLKVEEILLKIHCNELLIAKTKEDKQDFARKILNDLCEQNIPWKYPTDSAIIPAMANSIVVQVTVSGLSLKGEKNQWDTSFMSTLHTLGQLYQNNCKISLEKLYPEVSLPLPSTVPSLSPLVKWNYHRTFSLDHILVPPDSNVYTAHFGSMWFSFDPRMSEDMFLLDHQIDGRYLFPATGYLAMAYACAARLQKRVATDVSVELKDVVFMRATLVNPDKELLLQCRMDKQTGAFEIKERDVMVVSGTAKITDFDGSLPDFLPEPDETNGNRYMMTPNDVYKEFRVRGYDYDPYFQAVNEVTSDGREGSVFWRDTLPKAARESVASMRERTDFIEMDWLRRWITFLDSMMQLMLMSDRAIGRGLFVPTKVTAIRCNPKAFIESIKSSPTTEDALTGGEKAAIKCYGCSFENSVFTQGLQLVGLKTSLIKRQIDPVQVAAIRQHSICHSANLSITETETNDENNNDEKKSNAKFDSEKFYQPQVIEAYLQLISQNLFNKKSTLSVTEIRAQDAEWTMKEPIEDFVLKCVYSDLMGLNFGSVQDFSKVENGKTLIIRRTFSESNADEMKKLFSATENRGFLMSFTCGDQQTNQVNTEAIGAGFKMIGTKGISINGQESFTLSLLRKQETILLPEEQIVLPVDIDDCSWVDNLKNFMTEGVKESARIWLIPKPKTHLSQAKASGLIGVTKSLRYEPGGDAIRCVIDYRLKGKLDFTDPKYRHLLTNDLAVNVFDEETLSWKAQTTYFIDVDKEIASKNFPKHLYLKPLSPGDLSSLAWVESEISAKNESSNLVDVYYAPLNFKDVMYASGNLPLDLLYGVSPVQAKDSLLGLEFSGIDHEGKRIFGTLPFKAMATTVDLAADDFSFPVPDDWTLEQASTIPVVYLTALYAINVKGKVLPGESILIHAGAGGVGLAALNICLHKGCQVYTTVGSDEKIKFLLDEFPQLKREHIFNSRALTFEDDLMRATNGEGVDAVLNSLAGAFLKSGLRCLKNNGRFLEIGKTDLLRDTPLDTQDYDGNKSFMGVCLDRVFKIKDIYGHEYPMQEIDRQALGKMLMDGIAEGYVKPIKTNVFPMHQAEDAFRFMASGKHIGKIVLKIRDERSPNEINADKQLLRFSKQSFFKPHKSYIVVGGLGGLGLEVAQWMTERGARNIVLVGRRGIRESYQRYCIDRMKKNGVKVVVANHDATSEDGVIKLIEEAYKLGAIGGVINSVAVLQDTLFESITPQAFESVAASKSMSTYYLDLVTREYCPELDYFICFSSISNNRGNPGQANYNFGNSTMEAICCNRRRDGLHGQAVQWGIIGDVGLVLELGGYNGTVLLSSKTQRIDSCLHTLDKLMQLDETIVLSYVRSHAKDGAGDENNLMKLLNRVLGFKDAGAIDKNATLGSLGIDSLMAVEMQQVIERVKGVSVSIKALREMTMNQLLDMATSE